MELDSLMKSVETLKDYHFKDAAERQRAVIATRSAADALQNPMEKLMELWSGVIICLISKWFFQTPC